MHTCTPCGECGDERDVGEHGSGELGLDVIRDSTAAATPATDTDGEQAADGDGDGDGDAPADGIPAGAGAVTVRPADTASAGVAAAPDDGFDA